MNRQQLSHAGKVIVNVAGVLCFSAAALEVSADALTWKFLLVLLITAFIAPRMSIALPRSRFAISFSDAAVFISFLLFGGPAAIVVAAVETLANCLHLRSKGFQFSRLMIPTNASLNAVSFSVTYLIWRTVTGFAILPSEPTSTQHLFSTLGSLALIQFAVSTVIASGFQSLTDGSNPWESWKRDCFSSSLTQIVGAGVAGIIFKLINFGDLLTGAIGFFALTIAYFSYRQSISRIGQAINLAESAEREKADVERRGRHEAENHAGQLALSLEKEEMANEALRRSEKDLQHAALYDSLTDLPNRKHLTDKLRRLIESYRDDPSNTFHVLFVDIRRFKHINDSLGHTLGDRVLGVVAKRFVRMLTDKDLVARLGGDEFAIILKNVSTVGKAQKVARRLLTSIAQPFSLNGNRITISINVGVAPCDDEYSTPEEILRDADIAMHYAKEKNSGVAVFTKDLRDRFLERVRLENDLRNAIDRNELAMHYQPLIDLSDGSLMGFEALLRWHHSELGMIPPNKFIPMAEESGLIIPITVWILSETTRQLAAWQKIGHRYGSLIVSVNISGKHLSKDELVDDVEAAIELSGISPSTLKLEITESAAMENAEHTISILNRLKGLGVQLSIDDFGTGYSSLSYLHRLPFDTLKIDRSFVYSVGESGENSEILQTIISLAKSLKKKVIAEGIETESQLHLLQNLGCDYGQGYLMARPQSRENAERALYERSNWLPDTVTPGVGVPHTADESLPVF